MRSRLPLPLILAYLATLAAPLRTSWACADGTQCVPDGARGYVCPGGACSSQSSCCVEKRAVACKHGAFPSSRSAPTDRGIESPDHCRFSISAAPKLVAAPETCVAGIPALDALPVRVATDVPLPEFVPAWRLESSLGYRPPPRQRTGPSRAPPNQ